MIGADKVDAIRLMVGSGKSDRTIAKALGVSKGVVSGTIWRHGMRTGGVSAIKIRREWTDEEMVRIHALIAAGASLQAIGKDVGLARETVRCRFKVLGLATQPNAQHGGRMVRVAPKPKQRVVKVVKKSIPLVAKTVVVADTVPPIPKSSAPLVMHTGRVSKCAFLKGTRRNYIACDKPTVPGKSYCDDHCRVCFVGWGDSSHVSNMPPVSINVHTSEGEYARSHHG